MNPVDGQVVVVGMNGSDVYPLVTGEVSKQDLKISGAKLSDDGKVLSLRLPQLRPVDQLLLRLKLTDSLGEPFRALRLKYVFACVWLRYEGRGNR